ncbi:hypothetical protein [Nocardia wallacei]|nr:hypothetical protein [Nocardia wallacei]
MTLVTPRRAELTVSIPAVVRRDHSLGYAGGLNLHYKYVNQDRLHGDPDHVLTAAGDRWLLTRPAALSDDRRAHLDKQVAACPEMTALAQAVREFTQPHERTTRRRAGLLDRAGPRGRAHRART